MSEFSKEYYDYLASCGFTDKEIKQKEKEAEEMVRIYQNRDEREITSAAYQRAQKRLNRKVTEWLGVK